MNRLHTRYLIIAAASVALSAALMQWLLISLPAQGGAMLAGAAFIAGYLAALVATGTVAILGARKAAEGFTDPRIGRVAGLAMGVWVGVGAIAGLVISALLLMLQVPAAAPRAGLVVVFGLVCFLVAVVAGAITGRETAQPPEAEEEA